VLHGLLGGPGLHRCNRGLAALRVRRAGQGGNDSFGERLPEDAVREAWKSASEADLFLVIGSSLQVQPAAGLPLQAKRSGARLAIVNRDATHVDSQADLLVRGSIGAVFSALHRQAVN
jgi:NAD-dependent SIR2 family protein deacetylase